MSKKNSTQSKKSVEEPKAANLGLAIVALIVASLPLFFFENPLALHDQGILKGFYGIAIWPAAVLAGYAFFADVSFVNKIEKPWIVDDSKRALAVITVLVAGIVFLVQRYQSSYVGMEAMRPWAELATVIPLFAGLRLLDALFFQGIWQGAVHAKRTRAFRIAIVALAVIALQIGYVFAIGETGFLFRPEQWIGYVGTSVVIALCGALWFEIGCSVWVVALLNAILGAAFVWFNQGVFL